MLLFSLCIFWRENELKGEIQIKKEYANAHVHVLERIPYYISGKLIVVLLRKVK